MGYEWLVPALNSLRGIEPHEVMQVLGGKRRRPRPARGPDGHPVLTIWGRTTDGKPVIVVVRRLETWDWQIIGARVMHPGEASEFEAWEER